MSIRDVKGAVVDRIPVKTVLLSVFDKSGLEDLVPLLMEHCRGVRFLSTGGTYKKLKTILGDEHADRLQSVEEYTGADEMEGGLVKTLQGKVHAGILGERNNPAHQQYLDDFHLEGHGTEPGVFIDAVIVNLYPFEKVTADPDCTLEQARGNIDIGGPTMLRAAAKNFLGCCPVVDPSDYQLLLEHVARNEGHTNLALRASLAQKVFTETEKYDSRIAAYFAEKIPLDTDALNGLYGIEKRGD